MFQEVVTMVDRYPDAVDRKIFRIRLAALSLVLAGIFFVLYPAIRPFSDEISLQGAAAFASPSWVVAHSLAIAAFILLTLGLCGLYIHLQETAVERLAFLALILSWIGVGWTLPYYGAETYALHAIGQEALQQNNAALLSLANSIRFGVGIVFFGTGLFLIAVGTILFGIAIWKSHTLPKWSGILLAIGFGLYIPQYVTPQIVRVLHGLLIMVACAWIGWNMSNRNMAPQDRPAALKVAGQK
jgi:hypothetical protein